EGHRRPGQGREGRLAGREFGRWPPGDNGSDGCRKAEGIWLSDHAGRRYGRRGWDGLLSLARSQARSGAKSLVYDPQAWLSAPVGAIDARGWWRYEDFRDTGRGC